MPGRHPTDVSQAGGSDLMNIPIPHFPASLRPPVWRHPDAAGRDGGTDNISPQERLYRYRLQAWVSPAGQGASGGSSSSPLLTDLAAYWKLDDLTWSDSIGSNNLTNNSSVTVGTPKVGAGSAEFDGSGQSLNVSAANAYENISFSAWFYAANTSLIHVIFNQYSSSTSGFGVWINSDELAIYDDIDGLDVVRYNTAVSVNTWYHVVCTIDGNNSNEQQLWLNGSLVGSGATSTLGFSSVGGEFVLGARRTSDSVWPFDGRIDEVGIWKRLLTSGEISDLYNGGSGLSYPFS
jgi:hypothetical protein